MSCWMNVYYIVILAWAIFYFFMSLRSGKLLLYSNPRANKATPAIKILEVHHSKSIIETISKLFESCTFYIFDSLLVLGINTKGSEFYIVESTGYQMQMVSLCVQNSCKFLLSFYYIIRGT